MRLLRDKALASRVLILLELRRKPRATLKPLARAVGLTPQAVSGYVKRLQASGLVERRDGLWTVTPVGLEKLEDELEDLKDFADAAVRDLVHVDSTTAIAGSRLAKGTHVGLFMERGRLVARPGRSSPSQGVAAGPAAAGQDVLVESLEGIVHIPPASLIIAEVPSSTAGGSRAASSAGVHALAIHFANARWAALDELGEGVLRTTDLDWHLELAPLEAARAAVARGVSAVMVGGPESSARLVAALEAARAEGRTASLDYEVVNLEKKWKKRRG
jgi:predicted transcriptional regulator